MSILIRGTEMPKEGTVFVIDSTGQVWSNEWPTRGYIRLDGVKAVPVPAHGRLIDADALLELIGFEVRHYVVKDEYDKGRVAAWNNVIHAIREYAPTIIPADLAEEGE